MIADIIKFRKILAQLPFDKYWQIGEETGEFLQQIIQENQYSKVCEVGSSCGYSALWMMEVLASNPQAHLDCIESHKDRSSLARYNINLVKPPNLSVEIHQAHAPECFQSFDSLSYDLVFIDATKHQTREIFEALYPHLNLGGSILVDNVLSHPEQMQPFLDYLQQNKIEFQIFNMDAGILRVKKNS